MDKIIYTLVIAFIGGFIGIKLKIPAGALIGAMFAVAAYNMYTGKGDIPANFKLIAQIVVGGMIGLNFNTGTISGLKELIVPSFLLAAGLILNSIILGFVISKLTGLDMITALFSSAPGGIADMTLISDAYGADTPKVALLHLVRLISVISMMPFAIGWFSKFLSK